MAQASPERLNVPEIQEEILKGVTRRTFFGQFGFGLGSVALASMLQRESRSADVASPSSNLGKAKHVIYLHMAGSPSQLDLFDDKPALRMFTGKPCPDELLKGKRFAFISGVPNMLGSPFSFKRHGQSGAELSSLWKHLPRVIDDFAIVKSLHTDQFNHAPAQLYLQTGSPLFGSPSMGAWTTYGLGTENEDLPGFVVLTSGGKTPDAGKSVWGSGFLPSIHQGVQCRSQGDPVLFLGNPDGMNRSARRDTLDTLNQLNQWQAEAIGDPETITRIAQYELAYRMQLAAPDVMDISKEPQHILDLYGAKPGFVPESDDAADPRTLYKGTDASFANNCLMARRLVESGVRFVQLYDWGWDHHGISPGEDIPHTLPIKVEQIDRALAGLITDLKQRGLFEETLVVWGGEFGRTPMQQNSPNQPFIGRDHHPYAFTALLAGGGIKGGQTYGKTDDIGYYIAEDAVDIRDLQALILRQVGLDPWKLHYNYQGLQQRLIGVEGKAKIPTRLIG